MTKKLYARMMKAACPIDPESMARNLPIIQHDTVPHAMADPGARQMFFFVDRADGAVFSITVYDTEDDLRHAMRDADSELRFSTLAALGCTPLDARTFDVVAGAVNPDAPEVDFAALIPRPGEQPDRNPPANS
jgi:hypothetical protein